MSFGSAVHSVRTGLSDFALLVARLALGAVFIAHGSQKLFEWGIPGTTQTFSQFGVPSSDVIAPLVSYTEFVGGILLVLGLFTPLAGIMLFGAMLGAVIFVHALKGVFVQSNGWELVAALGAGALILGFIGAGRISLDYLLFVRPVRRRAERKADEERERIAAEQLTERRRREEAEANLARLRDQQADAARAAEAALASTEHRGVASHPLSAERSAVAGEGITDQTAVFRPVGTEAPASHSVSDTETNRF